MIDKSKPGFRIVGLTVVPEPRKVAAPVEKPEKKEKPVETKKHAAR